MSDDDRERWARVCTTAGWLFLLAYLGVVTGLVRRAAAIDSSPFEDGVWGRRIEVLSFASLPQNLVVLVPAAAAAIGGTVLAGEIIDRQAIWLAQLLRIVAGVAYVVVAIAILGIVGIFFRSPDSIGDLDALLGRVGGILMAVALVRLAAEAERR